ncbi:MAG TPA: hemolysin III family protein [Paracoccaceae bacterium]|nr:hemolysin III family protein [Paracoccaceae bacterium]
MKHLAPRTGYSRAEYLSDAVVHVLGIALVLASVPVLITLTAFLRGDAPAMVGTSVYGLSLLAMILCSGLYNMIGQGRWAWLLQRLDHSAIYAKIAGTYTPFALLSGHGGWLVAGLWVAALLGMALKLASPHRFRWLALGLYLGMGWAGAVFGGDFVASLSPTVLTLILTGGLLYTAGVVLYLFDRLPFHYTAWHVFVLAASMVLYSAVTLQVLETAA